MIATIAAAGVIAIAHPHPNAQDLTSSLLAPSIAHPFGTDALGRDILSWTAWGTLNAVWIGLAVALIAGIIGTTVGLIAGTFGGVYDAVLMRIVDLQLAIPGLLLFIAASMVLGNSAATLVALLVVAAWVPYARVTRAKAKVIRMRAHFAAARLDGAGRWRLLTRHVLPLCVGTIAVILSAQAGLAIIWESSLSFVGLGLQPPEVSLGYMIYAGRTIIESAWWVSTFPGIAIVLLVVGFQLLGDAIGKNWSDPEIGA